MQSIHSRRHQVAAAPPSPRLLRSRSGSPAMSALETHTPAKPSVRRSNSTTRSKTSKINEGNLSPAKNDQDGRIGDYGFAKLLQRSHRCADSAAKRNRPAPSSPSAWALSPGRALPLSPAATKSPNCGKQKTELAGGRGGAMDGVLRYFRQKKAPKLREEEFHRLRILHNRLLQWRFVNARAEAWRTSTKIVAEEKLLNVWIRTFQLRSSIVERRAKVQKLRNEIKLHRVVNPQIGLLKEWGRMESKFSEAVGRVTRKLSAIAVRLPLVHGAEANVSSVNNMMNVAMEVMEDIEGVTTKFLPQVERICFLITELIVMQKQQEEHMKDLQKTISTTASLEAKERSFRVHLSQIAMHGDAANLMEAYCINN
ncbi:QWRF motif-containing protein 7 isoform X2 [Diospyros lotus]|uniref:QWRF motif-containing protein 7 isoform X2 n=1 Tax=Diospyros lotus TaxID=55363 RepID=UPI0022509BA6|nr:QWRF motif-containing protein 7 isoform X2 [Diospyros lotus]